MDKKGLHCMLVEKSYLWDAMMASTGFYWSHLHGEHEGREPEVENG